MSTDGTKLWFSFAEPVAAETRIWLGTDLRHRLGDLTRAEFGPTRCIALVDPGVLQGWETALRTALGEDVPLLELPRGEACKTPAQWVETTRTLLEHGLGRQGYLIAIGGGATCDLAGAVASTYLRGIPVVHVPTTLLGMVDAGLGGKCAVNLPEGKNLMGSFHHPRLLVVDPEFLRTLPNEELVAGFAEVCKYALGFSAELLRTLRELALPSQDVQGLHYEACPPAFWEGVLEYCLTIKGNVVSADPREGEGGRRILLNLGHTAAHALETLAARRGVALSHGQAVGLGLRVVLDLANHLGRYPASEHRIAQELLDRFGQLRRVPWGEASFPEAELTEILLRDKKRRHDGLLRIVLPLPRSNAMTYELPAAQFVARMQKLFD